MPNTGLITAGKALSDFGESLGKLAYLQMIMKNIEEDNLRQEMQRKFEEEKLRAQIGLELLPGMRAYGATPEQQDVVRRMLNVPPTLTPEGPTKEAAGLPGILTPEQILSSEREKSYATAYAKALGENLLEAETTPEVARRKLQAEKIEQAEATAKAYAKAEVWKQREISAMEQKFLNDIADELGLAGKEKARWLATKKLPLNDLSDKELLDLGLKYKTFANILSQNLGIKIDSEYANIAANYPKMSSEEIEKKQKLINDMLSMKTQLENGVITSIPGALGVLNELASRGYTLTQVESGD